MTNNANQKIRPDGLEGNLWCPSQSCSTSSVCGCVCVCVSQKLNCVWPFMTPWTVAHQAPLQNFPSRNTGVGCHVLLQGNYPTQGLNPRLLHWQADSLPLCHLGSPKGITRVTIVLALSFDTSFFPLFNVHSCGFLKIIIILWAGNLM